MKPLKNLRVVPQKKPTADYLLWWDRTFRCARVASGKWRGWHWPLDHDTFYRRDWAYVGTIDGHRIKRINHNSKPLSGLLRPGLRKIFMSTLRSLPCDSRRVG